MPNKTPSPSVPAPKPADTHMEPKRIPVETRHPLTKQWIKKETKPRHC